MIVIKVFGIKNEDSVSGLNLSKLVATIDLKTLVFSGLLTVHRIDAKSPKQSPIQSTLQAQSCLASVMPLPLLKNILKVIPNAVV